MQSMKAILGLGLILLCGPAVLADPPDPAHTTVMPAVEVSNQPLEKVLDQIRAKVPWFHYVVFRSPSAPADYPKLPTMSVDGVTIEQFLNVVKTEYPGVTISQIEGDKQPLYTVDIKDPTKPINGNVQSLFNTANGPDPLPMPEKPVVKVYHLGDVIKGNDPKTSMNDVLTLVQATFDAAGGDAKDKPVLNVHPATQTLIFKGSPEKMQLLEQVLESLRPKESEETAKLKSHVDELEVELEKQESEQKRLIDELNRSTIEGRTLKDRLLEAQLENGRLQGQLKATTQPSK